MLRIAICDDMEAFGEKLSGIVNKWAANRHLNVQVKTFLSGEELLAEIESTGYFDIVLLDIDLGEGMDGIQTAAQLKKIYEHICLIFVSQYDNFYREAFQVHPFYYMEKSWSEVKLHKYLDQAADSYRYLNEIYVFRFKKMSYSILLRNVLYFVSDRRTIQIRMEDGTDFVFYGKMDELEQKLKNYRIRFLRIHQSYLVNGRQVEQCHSKYLIMRNKDRLPVSMDKRSSVVQFHMELFEMFS